MPETRSLEWRISIDYYTIKVKDAIGEQSIDIVERQCTDPIYNPTFDPNSPYCDGFKRLAVGGLGNVQRTFLNNGRFKTSGIDFQLNWGMDAGPGRVTVSTLINYLLDKKSAELANLPLVDYAGTFGPNQNGINGNSYKWRALTEIGYTIQDLGLTLRWQHLDSIDSADSANNPATTIQGAPSHDLFDLLGTYNVTDSLKLRFGIENLFDEDPPLWGRNSDPPEGVVHGGSYYSAQYGNSYDQLGRRFYLGARMYF